MRNKNAKVSDPNKFFSCEGAKYHTTYDPKVNPDGTISLVENGYEDIQQIIESYRDSTDIAYIIKRLEAGDTSVLNQKTPMFGDFTELPKSYADALQMVIDAESKFYSLDPDLRNKFDNDYRQWFAQAGSNDWIDKMGLRNSESPIENLDVEGDIE